jgi:hypothetical protein
VTTASKKAAKTKARSKADRPKVPSGLEDDVLSKSARRCAMCFYLKRDFDAKLQGQMHHIDENPKNNRLDNLVYLCHDHHDDCHTQRWLSKKIRPNEIKRWRKHLYEYVQAGLLPPWLARQSEKGSAVKHKVSIEMYDRRLPIYIATRGFVESIAIKGRVDRDKMAEFAGHVELSMFMFGTDLADCLETIYRKAVDLDTCAAQMKIREIWSDSEWGKLCREKHGLMIWFVRQLTPLRSRFAPYMTLGNS